MLDTDNKPLVTDDLLTELAHPNPEAAFGEFDAETRALLAIALPEMAAELLQRRQADRQRPSCLSITQSPAAIEDQLDKARQTIRSPDLIGTRDLSNACQTLLIYSKNASERAAAADVLTQLKEAA